MRSSFLTGMPDEIDALGVSNFDFFDLAIWHALHTIL